MCLIALAYQVHPHYPLIVLANRDEFYDRPTAAAALWQDAPEVFAGRDLVHGGTWLGTTRGGRFAALTNYREPHPQTDAPSRGALVSGFLSSKTDAETYLEQLRSQDHAYHGYNLLVGDADRLFWYSNRSGRVVQLPPGIHGLSNHLLDTPWPKVRRCKELLAEALAAGRLSREELFGILADGTRAPDEELPDTGVGLELERLLSSIFIASERYGTRSSTLLLMGSDRTLQFVERSYLGGGDPVDVEASFRL